MKKSLALILSLIFGMVFSIRVSADIPMVHSFSVPTSLESGQPANLSWTIEGGGHSLIIFCAQGIKIRYVATNLPFPCDTKVSVSKYASEGVSLFIANVSGSPRIVTARIIPKDPDGAVDYDAGAKESTIYVNPSQQPIGGFYTNATSTVSDGVTTFYWSSDYLDGVNLKIACNENITATSTSYGLNTVPCNQMIFPTDLPGSGSVAFKFNNQSTVGLPLTVTLFPAMSPGIYDGTHAQTLTLTVASDAQKPLAIKFNASRDKIYSGDSVLFDWSVLNGVGANIKFTCSPSLQLRAFSVSTTTTLACGDYAWSTNFISNASTSVTFINLSSKDEISTATLFPVLKNGTYDGNNAQAITINVAPVSSSAQMSAQIMPTTATISSIIGSAPSTLSPPVSSSAQMSAQIMPTTATISSIIGSAPSTPSAVDKHIFKIPLRFGVRSEEVKLLQEFLAKDNSLYPERLVTGYFGTLTKRAVGRFQIKFGIVKNSTDRGYGVVGPKTRFSLNALY